MMDWERFWWTNITGPRAFVVQAADHLLDKKIVVLKISGDLAWRHEMRYAIEHEFKSRYGTDEPVFRSIDAADEFPEDADVGRFLLSRYASSQIQMGFRAGKGNTIQKYIMENDVLRDSIVWVKGLNRKNAAAWVSFCKNYVSSSIRSGLFVLEIRDDMEVPETRQVKVLKMDHFVSRYDVQIFSSFILSTQKSFSDHWKNYISTLTARLCGTDAEVAELYLRITDFEREEPLEGIKRICQMGEFDLRGGKAGSAHPLALWRSGNVTALEQQVWTAQVQTIFPLVELRRIALIRKWEDTITQCLTKEKIMQYKVQLHDPFDVEFGTMVYLMDTRNEEGLYHIYISEEGDREAIHALHGCRNKLAHASCCTPEQVRYVLG